MIKQYIKLNKSSLNTKLCKEIKKYIKINAWNFRAGLKPGPGFPTSYVGHPFFEFSGSR
jgi:hypothetical protein